ncbi:AI-2E family transporter [Pilibacter termitis]|nr:AI-2E family transporter [Pilibacter termitis]
MKSWFWKWFLNNKTVTTLLILFLVLLNLFIFTKVSYLFAPVGQFVAIVGLPILLAVVFYYLLNPIVDFLEKKGVHRIASIAGIFVLLLGLLVLGIVVVLPKIQQQTVSFFQHVPDYVKVIDTKGREILENSVFDPYRSQILEVSNDISKKIIEWAQQISTDVFNGIGNIVSMITTVVLGLITMPFILFYLLKDGKELLPNFLKLLPLKWRSSTKSVLVDVNNQISSYIRGQLTVALAVAIMFIIGFNIIGLDYAITLGISAGLLNMIPYLGSFLAMIPAVVLGIVVGPVMLVKVLVLFVVEQTLEGRLIAPIVLGSQLAVHPVTILIVLLTSGKVGGLMGVIVGIPVYASIKVLVVHFYQWHRRVSGLYEEEEVTPEVETVE